MSNGTVNIPHAILQKPSNPTNASHATKGPVKRTNQPRLKLLIRRLPPGLTAAEFESALGPEWKLGGGKVDWFVYRHGKISKDLAKPSRPARAYLHLTDAAHIVGLSEKVRHTEFLDAKNTTRDNALLGPPNVEFAPYTRIPASRKRKDARVGTIDQEPEFIAFLESLTNPIQKPVGDLEPSQKGEKWTTTPLIEHIREKKAKKDKPTSSKSSKRDGKDATKAKASKDVSATASPDKSKKQTKTTRAAKEAVKVLNRQASATISAAVVSSATEKSGAAQATPDKHQPERRRERPVAQFNLAAKIQRDLGLNPTPRRASKGQKATTELGSGTSASTALPAKEETSSTAHTSSNTTTTTTAGSKREPRGRDRRNSKPTKPEAAKADGGNTSRSTPAPPIILKKPAAQSSTNKESASKQVGQPTASNSVTGTRAFLKHANQSQGITELLLKTALSAFGPVLRVEIDQKKGIAHADFATSQGLAAAIAKGKVEVGNGAVIVSEFKERPRRERTTATAASTSSNTAGTATPLPSTRTNESGGGRGRGSRGRGGRGRPQLAQPQAQGLNSVASTSTAPTQATATAPAAAPVSNG